MKASHHHILIVEDDLDFGELMLGYLRNHTVKHVLTCAEALEQVQKHDFDIILLDLGLPDVTGFGGLTKIRDRAPDVPIVILTVRDSMELALDAVARGADDYLTKCDLDPGLLRKTVEYAVERCRYHRRQGELLDAIRRVGLTVTRERDINKIGEHVIHEARARANAEVGVFFKTTSAGLEVVARASGQEPDIELWNEIVSLPFTPLKSDESDASAGEASASSPGEVGSRDTGERKLKSVLRVPILSREGNIAGELRLGHTSPSFFTETRVRFIEGLSSWAGVALDNADVFMLREQAARAREDMVAIVSHDLRNPLQRISMATELLRETGSESQQRLISKLSRATESMEHLIDDLVDAAAIEYGSLRVELNRDQIARVVESCCEAQVDLAREKGISLRWQIADDLPTLLMDRSRIEQALTNLLSNAIKASPQGSEVSVSCSVQSDAIRVEVTDNGPGIPDDELSQLFDRFYRGKRASKPGAGLGLAIFKGIIDAHGGQVKARNLVDGGASFQFDLPILERGVRYSAV